MHNNSRILKVSLSVLTATVLLSLSGFFVANSVQAATILNVVSNPTNATYYSDVVKAADHLLSQQNSDGGWAWYGTPSALSDENLFGVTALGLLNAYQLTHKAGYLTGATKAADYLVAKSIPTDAATDGTTGHKFYSQDIVFLAKMAQVTGNAAYSSKAAALMTHFVSEPNRYCTSGCATAESIADKYHNIYPQPAGTAEWQLSSWVEAAQLTGQTTWGTNLANIVKTDVLDSAYAPTLNLTQDKNYALGLAAALKATALFSIIENADIKTKLLAEQNGITGAITANLSDGVNQATAYSVLGLSAAGDSSHAMISAHFFTGNQNPNGGWTESDTHEYTEVNSEIIQAIFSILPPGTYYAIQDAVNAATSGDTINVAAGNYIENITIDKSLTLIGESSSIVAVIAAINTAIVFIVDADNVNISGFTVNGTGATEVGQAGIYINNSRTGSNIHDNILTGNYDGIRLGSGSSLNTLSNNTLYSNYQGFEVYHSDYNTFTSNTANENTNYGIRIDGGSSNILTGNTFDSNVLAGIRLEEVITNLMLDRNSFTNSPIGIDIDVSVIDVSTWTVSNNNISGNTIYGVSNAGTGILNAENNWWGDATGPAHSTNPTGLGNAVSDNVDFDPWYTDAAMTTTNADAALSNAKSTALADLSAAFGSYTSTDYTDADWITLTGFNTNGIANINAAADLDAVALAKTTAINGMAGVAKIIRGGWTTPAVPATKIVGCVPGSGDLFDITSGKSCTVRATPAVPAGEVLGAATFNFVSDLKLGMKGDAVTELQKRLTDEGVYSGPITGYFGPLTSTGVKAYQEKYGISKVGIVGPLTRAQLNASQVAGATTGYQFTNNLQLGNSGEDVRQLQVFLKSQGTDIYPEGLMTGYLGSLTQKAIERFQVKYGIAKAGDEGYGYVGPKTRTKINSLQGL